MKQDITGKRTKIVGVTGGIGSGKSEVLAILNERFHSQNILADEVAHQLMEPGQKAYKQIIEQFGDGFLSEDGAIDRKAFAAFLFQSEEVRKQVNAIVHPLVKEEIRRQAFASTADLVIVEAALLIEEEYQGDICEELWYVYTSREKRIQRLIKNRGYSREKCGSIMASQLSDEEFREHCQRVIDNNGDHRDLEQVLDRLMRNVMEERETKLK